VLIASTRSGKKGRTPLPTINIGGLPDEVKKAMTTLRADDIPLSDVPRTDHLYWTYCP
jgi:hypothetical protein